MKYYKEFLDEQVVNKLYEVVNSTFLGFYSSSVDINIQRGEYLIMNGSVFYEKMGVRKFLNFTNEWHETPDYENYYKISVLFDGRPIDIDFRNNAVYNAPISMSYQGIQHINKIEIYTCESSTEESQVIYDSALCFYFDDGFAFIISVRNDISGRFIARLSNSSEVESFLTNYKLRRSIT